MHKLLARQLRRFLGPAESVPEPLAPFLAAVDAAYGQADADRALLERSLDTVSDELLAGREQLERALDESGRSAGKLRHTLSLLTATLEATADGVLVVDNDGRIVLSNERFAELWRGSREVFESRDGERILASVLSRLEEPAGFHARVVELRGENEESSFDVLSFRDERVVEAYSHPRRVDGRKVGRVWSFRDVTERKQLEAQLRQAQKMEAVGLLAGGVAHDFNNILTVLKFHADFLQHDVEMPARLRESACEIGAAANHAADLTRQLLAFSRKQVLRPVVLDVNGVVAGVEPMLRRLLGEDVRLVTASCEAARVLADRGQLEQVLVNLVVNARDAMPEGGTITVRTAPAAVDEGNPHVRTGILQPGPHVALSVGDTGSGIPPELLHRIFEPFFTTKEMGRGSGLGLSTVYGIVHQSGGVVEVASEPGRGTTVRVVLPLAVAAPSAEAEPRARAAASGTETVLVSEDESSLRALARRVLEMNGYRVLLARDGRDALEVAAAFDGRIDLLLTDVVMPTMHGRELSERLRQVRPELAVLFMSGYTDDEVLRRGALGAGTAFLQKPFTPAELAAAVRDVLDRRPHAEPAPPDKVADGAGGGPRRIFAVA